MPLSIIAAVDTNFVIGQSNGLPWGRIPADMKHFRDTTKGHTVAMGRKTFESIGRPLPNRRNIILTNAPDFKVEGCEIVHSVEEVLRLAVADEVFIIGGASVYKEFLPHTDKIYLTFIEGEFTGDAYFPLRDFSGWNKASEEIIEPNAETPYRLRFTIFSRGK